MLFGHGDDFYNASNEIKINYSSNVWHGANLAPLRAHLYARFEAVTRYPEPDAGSLKRLIAHQTAIGEENLIVTNGSITAFYLIAQAWAGARSTILYPTFAEYEDACALYGHRLTFVPTSTALSDLALEGQTFCWICNPNNPDGKLWSRAALWELIAKHPQTLFVVDQAYVAFTAEPLLQPSDTARLKNLILIQSISKAYDMPGLRIGYLIAAPEIVHKIKPYVIPWSVNALAIEAGTYILTHPEQFTLPLEQWQRETTELIAALNRLHTLEALPTATTFFLVRLRQGKASALKTYLLQQHGILIRDASNFRGLDESYFRLSTQPPAQNHHLLQALHAWR
ncbi:aminotransferase class I/II-fold pyridoxal phosphate-dependent enzyme [Parabacteroides sp. PF5-6]|uniref:aminotransferase class I/II-fold pyridoxal phosphate-dependent enzyme n=1 Tax=Parabacteroides sp. PF5-6 TaxID=1742403 RepID=UPI002405008E|nr:aminotransferase class I/II-fold pyridoxal phosphate-dependent enzyme [Parabacteroides sp. PF5-6]MDF9831489.1 threonine-phosphate decarboxylase [Parabacteroides sp. PF5-6]